MKVAALIRNELLFSSFSINRFLILSNTKGKYEGKLRVFFMIDGINPSNRAGHRYPARTRAAGQL
jgi:hypothetical protein